VSRVIGTLKDKSERDLQNCFDWFF